MILTTLVSCTPTGTGPGGSKVKLSNTITFEVIYIGHGHSARASIHLEAVPSDPKVFGGRSDGFPYPMDKSVVIPWEHTIYYEPGITIKATLTVMAFPMDIDDILECHVRVEGVDLPVVAYKATEFTKHTMICGN
jgi:hypothetical protein